MKPQVLPDAKAADAKAEVRHIVRFSGGAASWLAGKRVVEKYGTEGVILLTANTGSEADDWHEFVRLAAKDIGAKLVMLPPVEPDGIFALASKQGMLPSSRVAFCSRILKQEPLDAWVSRNSDASKAVHYFGFDCLEEHRLLRLRQRFPDWQIEAPLCWQPAIDKAGILKLLAETGLPYPAGYDLGMPHNNCLATGCVKGGHAYWLRFKEAYPDRYRQSEEAEQAFIKATGKPEASILKDRKGGKTKPLTLKDLRLRAEAQGQLDFDDFGSCACFA